MGRHQWLDDEPEYRVRGENRDRVRATQATNRPAEPDQSKRDQPGRRARSEPDTFRCRHCKTLVGPTLSGGRHRNHCPLCLHSLHVDGRTPGDRRSSCRSIMEPVGVLIKRSGEQAILHRCLGCGFERHNRVAADDSPLTVMRLRLIAWDALGVDSQAEETA